jgi:hypothetical protein
MTAPIATVPRIPMIAEMVRLLDVSIRLCREGIDIASEKPPGLSTVKPSPTSTTVARVAKRFDVPPPKQKIGRSYPPHAMRDEQAADHFSMSRSMWLKLVDEKKMPPGFKIPGHTMRFWNTVECQDRFDDLGRDDGEPSENTVQKRLRELADERRKKGRSD